MIALQILSDFALGVFMGALCRPRLVLGLVTILAIFDGVPLATARDEPRVEIVPQLPHNLCSFIAHAATLSSSGLQFSDPTLELSAAWFAHASAVGCLPDWRLKWHARKAERLIPRQIVMRHTSYVAAKKIRRPVRLAYGIGASMRAVDYSHRLAQEIRAPVSSN
jgi:hypothetical protein